MGHWGVRSYENDDADFAIDAGLERVHGDAYVDLMDDGNPLTIDQIQKKLASPATLDAALAYLYDELGALGDDWEDESRLAYCGVVVRHAELGVAIPEEVRLRALGWLRSEEIDWEEATIRRLRREREVELLEGLGGA